MAQSKKKKTPKNVEEDAVNETVAAGEADDVVDDDGHTLEDITPWDIDEDDDDKTAENAEDDPEEYENWDRDKGGSMADHAVEPEDEPECLSGDDVEVGE